ncbi:hypothetical protein RHMOL_Rhmol06G0147400 [Rhododendron molle]|uniref:Uncharacterized protein n=1 Tax=Rhododendron molle TaxID=49168 RepID=A0ACC0NDS6_RHOML|nr:hypothetical protein RHMOL_Rhmol06G0147400 [Rhododendron molle]
MGKLKQQIRGDLNAEMNPFVKEVTGKQAHGDFNGIYRSESDSTKEKKAIYCLLDMSQISGPDGKSKPTPASQIGFRGPPSFGGVPDLLFRPPSRVFVGGVVAVWIGVGAVGCWFLRLCSELRLVSLLGVIGSWLNGMAEALAESRGELQPVPHFDAINVIVLAFQEDNDSKLNVYVLLRSNTEQDQGNPDGISDCNVFASSEEKLFSHFMNIIRSIDPDILMGWDIQEPLVSDSIQHGDLISDDEWGWTHASGLHIGGRVVLNIWRLMGGELMLNMYTVEAVLRRRVAYIQCKVLAKLFSSGPGRARYRCIEYVVDRVELNLEIMNQLDMYHVESMLMRLARTHNYVAISPGSQQVFVSCLTLMDSDDAFIPVDYENVVAQSSYA